MIKKIAVSWAEFMTTHGAPKEQKAIYIYGLECVLNELVSDALLLFLALLLGRVWEMFIWIVVFNMFRLNVGGYHAGTSERCIFLSTMLGIVCVFAYPLFQAGIWIIAMMVICDSIIFFIAPVVNLKKRSITEQRIKSARRMSRILAVMATLLCVILVACSMESVAAMVAVSVCSVCGLGLLGKFKH